MSNRFYDVVYDYTKNFREYNQGLSKLEYGLESKKIILKQLKTNYPIGDKLKLNSLLTNDIIKQIKSSIPNSFSLKIDFTLKTPYYSKDDDEFYIVQNPCLKEKVFKVPMIRGSGWKGAILQSAIEILKEEPTIKNIESFFRIFGVGNSEFRELLENIDENRIKTFFALNFAINVKDKVEKIFEDYKEKKSKAQKGRAIFYPTYFSKLSLELINPHNRKTKAGTNPIHYEVVPKDEEGVLQIAYIPFDGVMESNKDIKKEAEQDFKFLKEAIDRVSKNGVGAKTKLGWGKFDILGEIEPIWSER